METESDNGPSESKEKENKVEEEIEVVGADFDFDDCYEEDFYDDFLGSEKTSLFSGSPLLLMHSKISCGAPSSWWLPLTEFEPAAWVHLAVPRSTYVFLGVAVAQVYLRMKKGDDDESLILSKQLSEIIGREFALIWKEDGLPESNEDKLELSFSLMEFSIVCASISWAVEHVEQIVLAADDAFPQSDWEAHTDDLEAILFSLRESLERAVDKLCTSSLGQKSAKYRDQETYH